MNTEARTSPESIPYASLETCQVLWEQLAEFTRLFFFSMAQHEDGLRNLVIRNFVARAIVTMRSLLVLYGEEDFHNCWVLYRCLVDRVFHLYSLHETDSFEAFEEYSFVTDMEGRNRIRSDKRFQEELNARFFRDSPEQQERYRALKAKGCEWKPPKAENVAKAMNMSFLYKHGYDFASLHVHPMASDGQDDFFRFMDQGDRVDTPDQSPVLMNSLLTVTLLLHTSLNASSVRWCKVAYDFLAAYQAAINSARPVDPSMLELVRTVYASRGGNLCEAKSDGDGPDDEPKNGSQNDHQDEVE